jgi:hypothetical protein
METKELQTICENHLKVLQKIRPNCDDILEKIRQQRREARKLRLKKAS